MKLKKRNVWRTFCAAEKACTITINRWLVPKAAALCKACGVQFKIDDSTINYEDDSVLAVVAAQDEASYIEAGYDLHRELGIDLSRI